jgi:succinate dehydrogenase / fumarate reductase cytochrome b subunit
MFLGEAEFDEYSESLRHLLHPLIPNTAFLWIMRIGLIVLFAIHLHAAYSLTVMNRRARPTKYSKRDYIAANWAARTMRWSGIIILAFLVIHLGNLTWGWQFLDNNQFVPDEVYHNVVTSLSQWWLAAIYIVAQLALGVHLFHGSWSIFQSLGVNNPKFNVLRKGFAYLFTAIVVIPNLSFPIAVMAGVVK